MYLCDALQPYLFNSPARKDVVLYAVRFCGKIIISILAMFILFIFIADRRVVNVFDSIRPVYLERYRYGVEMQTGIQ